MSELVAEDIDLGTISRQRFYRVRYGDGEMEHMTATQVLELTASMIG
jgi:hypothetical protein